MKTFPRLTAAGLLLALVGATAACSSGTAATATWPPAVFLSSGRGRPPREKR